VNLNELIDELGLLVRHKLANQNIRLVANCSRICRGAGRRAATGAGVFEFDSQCRRSDAGRRHADHQIAGRSPPAGERKPTHVSVEFKDTARA
jgi:hypothetical protein